MSVTLSVTGIKEIDQVLKGMPRELSHRVLQAAHSDAASPLVRMAQTKAPYRTGNLERSMGVVKPSIKNAREIGLVKVGPRLSKPYSGKHGHLIEYGHNIKTKSGRIVGRVKAMPFMSPAFDLTKNVVEAGIAKSIAQKLLAYMKRTIKSNA